MAKEKTAQFKATKDFLMTTNGRNSGLKFYKKDTEIDFKESYPETFASLFKDGYIEEIK